VTTCVVGKPSRVINRGGDRQLNRALHTIVMLRQVHHGPTRYYTSGRIAQGKSQREIRRCLMGHSGTDLAPCLARRRPEGVGR
jgi:hypothetical protein